MITGQDTLRKLDKTLRTVRGDVDRVDTELAYISEKLLSNRRQQAQVFSSLAGMRLEALSRNEIQGMLLSADEKVLRILEQRSLAFNGLQAEIERTNAELASLEDGRATAKTALDQAAQAVIDCEKEVQYQLENDTSYQAALAETRILDDIADEAEAKAETAEADRKDKGKDFESDPVFMYLWNKGYGTSAYSASALTRYLDSWAARLVHYEDYRVNYWTLLEIPKRLAVHATNARSDSDEAIDNLAATEQQFADRASLPELQDIEDSAQAGIDQIDTQIEEQESTLSQQLASRATYTEARDSHMEQCLGILSEALSHQTVRQLDRATDQTHTSRDDSMIHDLRDLQDEHDDLEDDLREQRQLHEAKLAKLKELEAVRKNFKHNRYDDIRSGFSDQEIIYSVLGQFLQGIIAGADVWRTLQRHQRHRDVGAWPDFGSGGLGNTRIRRPRKSPWHVPRSRQSRGGFKVPRSGGWSSRGRRGGGFKTGGGF